MNTAIDTLATGRTQAAQERERIHAGLNEDRLMLMLDYLQSHDQRPLKLEAFYCLIPAAAPTYASSQAA
jgi:hypothetical protein